MVLMKRKIEKYIAVTENLGEKRSYGKHSVLSTILCQQWYLQIEDDNHNQMGISTDGKWDNFVCQLNKMSGNDNNNNEKRKDIKRYPNSKRFNDWHFECLILHFKIRNHPCKTAHRKKSYYFSILLKYMLFFSYSKQFLAYINFRIFFYAVIYKCKYLTLILFSIKQIYFFYLK